MGLIVAQAIAAQTAVPNFTLSQRFLQPGRFLEIYGTNLAPAPVCQEPIPSAGPYPTQACGVRVTAGGISAGLFYVGAKQINVKLPESLPDGPAAVQVCVHDACSEPVVKEFSSHTAFLAIKEPAYAGMPIWINVELPYPYLVAYPCGIDPWDFRGPTVNGPSDPNEYKIEVRRNGVPLAQSPRPVSVAQWRGPNGECIGGLGAGFSPLSRLPLHLAYRLDTPGLYSVRLTGFQGANVVVQSSWMDFELKLAPQSVRFEWLRSMQEKIKSANTSELMRDIVPSLLASPDEDVVRTLLPVFLEWLRPRGLLNGQAFAASFIRNSLAAFDENVLRETIPASDLASICPPVGNCQTWGR